MGATGGFQLIKSSPPCTPRMESTSQLSDANWPVTLSVPSPGVEPKEGEGVPRRHPLIAGGGFIDHWDANIRTPYASFLEACRKYEDCDFLGVRSQIVDEDGQTVAGPFVFQSYGHVRRRVGNFAAGLSSRLELPPKSNVGLFSVNRPEWVMGEYACYALNYVTVPLYDTLGDDAIVHICNQTEMKVAIVSVQKIGVLLRVLDRLETLRTLVVMDDKVPEAVAEQAKTAGLTLVLFADLEEAGAGVEGFEENPPAPDDLCTICYSSGTTGLPKGVMMKHSNLLAVSAAALALIGYNPLFPNENPIAKLESPGEVYLSYLPLAHVMERAIFATLLNLGFKFGFYQGDVNKLIEDCEALGPTFFVSVPRLFNRVRDKVIQKVEAKGGITQWLFEYALRSKTKAMKREGVLTDWLWDPLVFSSVRARLGGRVKCILTGSAPLSPQVIDFLRVVFSCPVIEGFGMTETAAITALTCPGDLTTGTIGTPVPCCEIKLVDIPEMGYTSADEPCPRGEIWIRGPSIFAGYYKDPEQTAAALRDGWMVSGDVGRWDASGRLYIIDRKKALFKLAQGEYVSPERVEGVICRSSQIAQAYVHGDSLRSSLLAVIVPDRETVEPWAASTLGLTGLAWEELCAHPALNAALLSVVQAHGSSGSKELKGFEVPRAIHLEPSLFSVENGLLTPTFKLKRVEAKARYADIFARLYDTIPE